MMKVLHSCYQIIELIYGSVTAEHRKMQLFKCMKLICACILKLDFYIFLRKWCGAYPYKSFGKNQSPNAFSMN